MRRQDLLHQCQGARHHRLRPLRQGAALDEGGLAARKLNKLDKANTRRKTGQDYSYTGTSNDATARDPSDSQRQRSDSPRHSVAYRRAVGRGASILVLMPYNILDACSMPLPDMI